MNKEVKTSFALSRLIYEQIALVKDDIKRLSLYDAIMRYAFYGDEPNFRDVDQDACLGSLFMGMRMAIDADAAGEGTKVEVEACHNLEPRLKAEAKVGTESKDDRKKPFAAPTIEEVRGYIAEKGYNIDADKFWFYYDSIGWRVGGKAKMANWHSAVATWVRNGNRYGDRTNNANQIVKVNGKSVKLGVGERLTPDGIREYEWNGNFYKVPAEAKPRPGLRYFWDAEYQQWNSTL